MKLYTSYFARIGSSPKAVSITVRKPPWFKGRHCPELSPSWDLVSSLKNGSITEAQYRFGFMQLINERHINFQKLAEQLGNGSILLCYEKPSKFCHRHIVAECFCDSGIEIEEMEL